MSLAERVTRIIVERLELEGFALANLGPDVVLFAPEGEGGAGLDSLAALEIVAALSDEFDLPFDDVEREDVMSVATLVQYLERHGATESP
jgi:acyl carrier protein